MSRGFTGAMMRAYGAGEWVLTVVSVEDITEHYRRIVVHAPGLFDGTPYGAASYLRLWAPDPDDPSKEYQRGYTIAALDEAREQMTMEFVLHDPAGPASTWARQAKPGDRIAATRWGAPRFIAPDPAPAGYLLVGDPAALPGINGILSELPDDVPIHLYLEFTHDSDRTLPVVERVGLRITWVRRTGDAEELMRAIEPRDYSDWFAWVTAESEATKAVRGQLKAWGFPRSHLKAQGYWKQGKEMGISRDDAPVVEAPKQEPAAQPAFGRWSAASGTELLRPLRIPLVMAGIVQALVSLLELVPFILLAELGSRLIAGERDPSRFWALGLTALIVMGVAAGVSVLLLLALHLMDARFGHEVRTALVARIGRVPLGWFTDRNSATVRGAVHDDVAGIHHLTTHAVIDAVAAVVTPVAVLLYLLVAHPGYAVFLLFPLIAVYVLTLRMFNASSWGVEVFERERSAVASAAGSHVEGIGTARIYDRGSGGRLAQTLARRAAFVDSWQRPLTGIKTTNDLATRPTTMLVYLILVGSPMYAAGWLDAGDLILFLLLGTTLASRLMIVAYSFVPVREALAAALRVARTLAEPVLAETDPARSLPIAGGDGGRRVRFESVTFGYAPDHPVLHDIDLDLSPGTVTALVGPSGAGKSTLAALLARFHDVDAGRITIDGTDIRDLATSDLYRAVSFVFQGSSLVRGTVHDNIALGRPETTREEVERAARAAQIHSRISRLDRGYDAVVGEDAQFSGGEAQRVAIARAILADPAILVLDEATAHADPESEHAVQAALSALVRGRTVLVVSHRLHTLTGADRIVVLDAGRIEQVGDHASLSVADGLYRELWRADAAADAAIDAETVGR